MREGAEGALAARIVAAVLVRHRLQQRRVLLDVVDIQHLQHRRVRIGEPHLQLAGVVAVEIGMHRRRVPDVVLPERVALALDDRCAGALDAEIHLGRVLPHDDRALAGLQHLERHLDSRREAVALAGEGMGDQGAAAAVLRLGLARQPVDLTVDGLLGDHHRRPKLDRIRRHAGAVQKHRPGIGHVGLLISRTPRHAAAASPARGEGTAGPGPGPGRGGKSRCRGTGRKFPSPWP